MLLTHETTIVLNKNDANIVGHMCYAAAVAIMKTREVLLQCIMAWLTLQWVITADIHPVKVKLAMLR